MARRKSNAAKAAERAVKKTHTATIILAVLFLIVGAVAGVLVSRNLTKDDRFVLNGDEVVRIEVGGSFADEGATVVSFGKDISSKVAIGGDTLNAGQEGIYQLVYTVDDFRWGDYQLVRVVIVGDPEGAEDFLNG